MLSTDPAPGAGPPAPVARFESERQAAVDELFELLRHSRFAALFRDFDLTLMARNGEWVPRADIREHAFPSK